MSSGIQESFHLESVYTGSGENQVLISLFMKTLEVILSALYDYVALKVAPSALSQSLRVC
jgi:hypothetical protein